MAASTGARVGLGKDQWLSDYESCERLVQDVRERIEERDRFPPNDRNFSKENAHIRPLIKRLNDSVSDLRQNLIRSVSTSQITAMEGDRRQIKLDSLVSNVSRVETAFKGPTYNTTTQRSSLLGNDFPLPRGSTNPWASALDDDDDETLEGFSVENARVQQQQIMQRQDDNLDALSSVISRQKALAYAIGEEADRHNEIIDDITDHVDRTRDRLIRETRHVNIVSKKSDTCWYWIIIILLMVAIIVIVSVPFK
ncbi:Syntaxin-8 [Chamberlinius hualienensis]